MSNQYLANEKVGTLMFKFSVPCILSLLISSLYNIVDQIFIGHGVGYLGNGATNVVFPLTIIALAIALFIGDGCAAFLSICQGKKDDESAHKSVGSSIVLVVVLSIILVVVSFMFRDGILGVFGSTESNRVYAVEYFKYIMIGIPFFMFYNAMNSIIRADGSPQFAMFATIIGAVINVIFDAITIMGLGWGMMGAGIATSAGQIVSAILCIGYLFHSKSFKLHKKSFGLHKVMSQFLPLGISSFLTQMAIVVTMAVMNNELVKQGASTEYGSDIPLTAVGIVMKVFQIVVAFVVGIAAGCQPIVGYNYGAGHLSRVKEIYKKMILSEAIIGAVFMFCFEVFPVQILNIFGAGNELYTQYGKTAFQIYLFTILLCCVQKATSIFMQSLGKPVVSMLLSLSRDFILLVPLIVFLGEKYGVIGILYSAPIADVIAFIIVLFFVAFVMKNLGQNDEKVKGTSSSMAS